MFADFDEMVEMLKRIANEFPKIKFTVNGEDKNTYGDFECEYEIEYNDGTMTIKQSENYYKWYPEDYDKFVELCENFDIKNVIKEEEWEALNEDSDGWYFIKGGEAKTSIELSDKEVIKL